MEDVCCGGEFEGGAVVVIVITGAVSDAGVVGEVVAVVAVALAVRPAGTALRL